MSLYKRLKENRFFKFTKNEPEEEPLDAYELWAAGYDTQHGNLMLDLDETLFSAMIKNVHAQDKTLLDFGCGTGRHWQELFLLKPARLIGIDISSRMLDELHKKFPTAETYLYEEKFPEDLHGLQANIIISNLTIAHIAEIEPLLNTWKNKLSVPGEIIITDYHPDAFIKGADRTFYYQGKKIAIKNYIHPLDHVRQIMTGLGFTEIYSKEIIIDSALKKYYQDANAMHVYKKFAGTPIIYGIHFKLLN